MLLALEAPREEKIPLMLYTLAPPAPGGCEFTVDRFHVGNDLRDKVYGPCNSTAAVVDGPFKMCGGPTFYSIDAVLSTGPLCPEEGAAWEEAMAQVQD